MSDAPRIIGRYALYGKIASGGMATVHLGRLLGPVGFSRTVAIKKMHAQFTEDPEFVSMFLDEARLAARIRHPNVVPTLDVVATDGELFLVMDYVQGETLARLQRLMKAQGRTVPLPVVAAIFSGILHGLHAAHEAKNERGEPLGIVHRDVSPQNVIVGVDGVARVLDFGVAKAAGRVQSTRAGQLKGKIPYMAPEQVRGKPATRQTDVYAVAVVLWEALTGKRLFQDDNDAAVMQRVLDGDVTLPSAHAPGLPEGLDAIVMRGLDRDAGRRFATAREMAGAIETLVPLAIPVHVGEWVEATAGPAIASQAARVAEIESASDASVFAPAEATHTAEPRPGPPVRPKATVASPGPVVAPLPAATPAEEAAADPPDLTEVAEHPPVADEAPEAPPVGPAGEAGAASQMSSISVSASPSLAPSPERTRVTRIVVGAVVGACALIGVTALIIRAGQRKSSSDVAVAVQTTEAPSASATATTPTTATVAVDVPRAPSAELPTNPPVVASPEPTARAADSAPTAPVASAPEIPKPPAPAPVITHRPNAPPPQPQVTSRPAATPPPQPSPPAAPKPAPSSRPKSGILFSNPG